MNSNQNVTKTSDLKINQMVWNFGVYFFKNNDKVILVNILNGQWIRIPNSVFTEIEKKEISSKVFSINLSGKNKINIAGILQYLVANNFVSNIDIGDMEIINIPQLVQKERNNLFENISFKTISINCSSSLVESIIPNLKKFKANNYRLIIIEGSCYKKIEELLEYTSNSNENHLFIVDVNCITHQLLNVITNKYPIIINGNNFLENSLITIEEENLLKKINLLASLNFKCSIACSYSEINNPHFKTLVHLSINNNIPLHLSHCSPASNRKRKVIPSDIITIFQDMLNEYISCKKTHLINVSQDYYRHLKLSCGAGKNGIYIDENGNIYPCEGLTAKEFFLGNITADDLNIIKKKAKNIFTLNGFEKYSSCRGCDIEYFCGNGCRARYINSKDEEGLSNDPLCEFIKRSVGQYPWVFTEGNSYEENIKTLVTNTK